MISFSESLRILGMKTGNRAFIGPRKVQIDLTDECPSNCVGCWVRSPFLLAGEQYDGMERGTLERAMVLDLVPQLRDMGVEQIFFGGGGDPFCHPDIMEIIEAFKLARMQVTINTNLLTMDDDRMRWLFDLKPDELIVSVWAGTAETYSAHHPNRTEGSFHEIVRLLKLLAELKKEASETLPRVKLYNVITKYNYFEIPKMIELGREVGAEVVEVAAFDPIPKRTDLFLLTPDQIAWVQNYFKEYLDEEPPQVWRDLLLRRLEHPDAVKGAYDNGVYYNTPCYAGWDYARVTTTGLVHSCLKSHRIPVGSLKDHSFHDIWFSDSQNEFREHTHKIDVDDPYLENIGHDIQFPLPGCFRICDNLGENQGRNDQIHGLSENESGMIAEMVKAAEAGADREGLEQVYKKFNPEEGE